MILVSFDIDGTMESGDPQGPITFENVRESQRRGHIVGSASDRTLAFQRGMWRESGIDVDFVSHKHHLVATKEQFACARHIHIGDTQVDEHFALLAGFEFVHVDQLPEPGTKGWVF